MTKTDSVTVEGIPLELRTLPQWVCWRLEKRNGKLTKVPYQPHGAKADSTDPATWSTFDRCLVAVPQKNFSGTGFVFSGDDPYCGFDLDKCLDPETGEIAPWADAIIARMDSYTELSQSRKGVHIIVKATLPPGRRRTDGIEMYDTGRFFVMTGDLYPGARSTIEPRQEVIAALHRELFPPAATAPSPRQQGTTPPLSERELLNKMCGAANGHKVTALWQGDTSGYPSGSEADMALCSHLAFWTAGDRARMDALFRQSGLMRDKWDERHGKQTYGQMTIAKALEDQTEFFDPGRQAPMTANGAARAREVAGVAEVALVPSQPRIPDPLRRELPHPERYPIDALGPLLAPVARRLIDVIQSPDAICAQSVLAAATLAAQGLCDVHIDGRTYPLSEYYLTLGESGERKTATDNAALWPHRQREYQLVTYYEEESLRFDDAREAYKKSREAALRKEKTYADRKIALELLGPPPIAPLKPLLTASEPTYEGLVRLLAEGQPSIGLFSNEGGRLIGGHGLNTDNQLKTAAGLSEAWDGQRIDRVRGGDGATALYGRRLSMHLMMQPGVARLLLGNALLLEQGVLSRCLAAYPETTAGQRFYRPVDLSQDAELRRYNAVMLELLRMDLPLAEGKRNELKPRALELTAGAKQLWTQFHDHVEGQLASDGPLEPIRSFASKVAEHVLRLSGVLTIIEDPMLNRFIPLNLKRQSRWYSSTSVKPFVYMGQRQQTPISSRLKNSWNGHNDMTPFTFGKSTALALMRCEMPKRPSVSLPSSKPTAG